MASKPRDNWRFWIDVGGTFTDCIAVSPGGKVTTCKLLSSGTIKGRVGEGGDARHIVDRSLADYPDGFFRGYELRWPGGDDALGASAGRVESFDAAAGRLTLAEALPSPPQAGAAFELSSGEPAPIVAIRLMMGLRLDEPIVGDAGAASPIRLRLGTTRGTNALLERKGARVALVTTQGLADLLAIGTQARPHLFRLHIEKPPPLAQRVVEVNERIAADGAVLTPLDEREVEASLRAIREQGFQSLAVCLLNAYVNAQHENLIAAVAARLGFEQVSVSSQLSPTIKMLDRCDTTVLDAYLSPVIRGYVARLREALPEAGASLKLMTSSGGLIDADAFAGKDSILSGPAGGVVGFAAAAQHAGFTRAIGFDMGGTSTDVSRFDGEYDYEFAAEKAGVRIVAPMYAIETVAAGGGSICRFDGQKLTVGPDSAGADPGPACYDRGGPLTVTDVNLFNGKIDLSRFPFALDPDVVQAKLDALAAEIETATGKYLSPVEIAAGFTKLANAKMSAAIRHVSAAKGYDPRDYVLVAFGGAAAQHACAIARALGIGHALLHPHAGVLSALGMGAAKLRRFAERTVLETYSPRALKLLESTWSAMADRLRGELAAEGVADEAIIVRRLLDLRYAGEDSSITVREPDDDDYAAAFHAMHEQLYGHVHHDRAIEIVNARAEAVAETDHAALDEMDDGERGRAVSPNAPRPLEHRTCHFDGRAHETPIYSRDQLKPGASLNGPAVVTEAYTTVVIEPGWRAEVTARGDLLLHDAGDAAPRAAVSTQRDPIQLELFNNHFTQIAVQMGVTLQRTSLSVNVKERLDFSCAVLDARGNLVVNAPHIPVHLGAMGEAVRGLLESVPDIRPGDVFAGNDPDLGGSHLPDITVMTPMFAPGPPGSKQLRFFTASRAHHAEIGGVRPGSAFPFATCLAEEGVVLRNLLIARGGRFLEDDLRNALTRAPYPSRSPKENIADIRAAVAANQVAVRELGAMIERYTWPVVEAYMRHIRDAAEEKTRAALSRLPRGVHSFRDTLDDGSPVCVTLTIDGGAMTIDFTGTGPVNPNSLNANRAIVLAAVMYCLRCLIDEDIPLNQGVLAPIRLVLPTCMLSPPHEPDPGKHVAVVGGNVELSQKVVDVIFGALGVVAASQGTMNNLVFGDDTFGYYETIGGGAGAGPGFDGADAVHTHMTNTRLTDVEGLEQRYPVRLRRFAIRRGSGGQAPRGGWRGGDGIVREIEFLRSVEVSLLTQRRATQPFGLRGGAAGLPGVNQLLRRGEASPQSLDALAQFTARPGDVLTLETPGGGACGPG